GRRGAESLAGEQSCESRQHRSICRLERWSVHLSSKHRHLVALHDDIDGKVRVTATDELDQLNHAAIRALEEGESHRRMLAAGGTGRQSPAHSRWMAFLALTGCGKPVFACVGCGLKSTGAHTPTWPQCRLHSSGAPGLYAKVPTKDVHVADARRLRGEHGR
ncbi:MAG: hypothetical protein ACYDEY_14120, partial [Acidimicrobiales bacterium]